MALIECAECGSQMSSDALACPQCGKPNKKALNSVQNSKQGVGCAIMVLALLSAMVLPPLIAGILFVIGLVVVIVNTRFS